MDPIFMVLFPIVAFLFIATDWPRLKKKSTGIRLAYATFMALSFGLFVSKAVGAYVPMPAHFFYTYVSPAIESMLGLK